MIKSALEDSRLTVKEVSDIIGQNSPIPVPESVISGVLDQMVSQGTIKKIEENGEVYYQMG